MVFAVTHSLAHIVSMVYENTPEQLYTDPMKQSGVAAFLLLLTTTLPMVLGFVKSKVC